MIKRPDFLAKQIKKKKKKKLNKLYKKMEREGRGIRMTSIPKSSKSQKRTGNLEELYGQTINSRIPKMCGKPHETQTPELCIGAPRRWRNRGSPETYPSQTPTLCENRQTIGARFRGQWKECRDSYPQERIEEEMSEKESLNRSPDFGDQLSGLMQIFRD